MAPPSEVRCVCGALNDEGFGNCIRCTRPLTPEGQKAERPRPQPARPTSDSPPLGRAALLLGGLTSFVFAMQLMLAAKRGRIPLIDAGHVSDALRVGALLVEPEWLIAEPFRLLSSVYVHFGLLHFAFNMFGFVSLARTAEHFVGTARTIITFVVTGVFGFAVTVAFQFLSEGRPTLTAGASGGILGVMGLLLGILMRRRDPRWKNFGIQAIFYTFLFGFAVNMSNAGFAVNNAAHFGGLFAGWLLGLTWGKGGVAEGTLTKMTANALLAASVVSLLLSGLSHRPNLIDF